MKPLSLALKAFGPYARAETIDFRALNDGGLFLIYGQTGAGKTSLLDGISFALFGTSSGADRTSEGMRSDLAADDQPTEVTFEFALARETYKVIRRPPQLLKRQRGEGVTQAPPKAELFKCEADGEWRLVTSGLAKTNEELINLLGMTENQFRQVVVLPQGQFRRFLSASSKEREDLLETLFRTERFRRLTERLQARANETAGSVEEKKQSEAALLSSIDLASPADLNARMVEIETQLKEISESTGALEAAAKLASERLGEARALAATVRDLERARELAGKLQARADEMEACRERIENDRRSRPVLVLDSEVRGLEKECAALQANHDDEAANLARAARDLTEVRARSTTLIALRSKIDVLKLERENLREIWNSAKQLRGEQANLQARETALDATILRLEKLNLYLLEARAGRERTQDALARAAESAARLEAHKSEQRHKSSDYERVNEELAAYEEAEMIAARERRLHHDFKIANESTRTRLLQLRISFHHSQALLLARELKPGAPCPVCGSQSHPTPASADPRSQEITNEALESAETAARHAAEQLARAETQLEHADQSLARARNKLARLLPAANLPAEAVFEEAKSERARLASVLKGLAQAVAAAENAEREKTELLKRQQLIERDLDRTENDLRSAAQERETLRAAAEASRAAVGVLFGKVPENLRDPDQITERGQKLKVEIESYELESAKNARELENKQIQIAASEARTATLLAQLTQKRALLLEKSARLAELLAVSGFASLDTCRAAGLSDDAVKKIENERRAYFDQKAVNDAALGDLSAKITSAPAWACDLPRCAAEFAEADERRSSAVGLHLAQKDKLRNLRSVAEKLAQLAGERQALEDSYRVLGRLAGVAGGQPPFNLSRVNFSRYVLASRLDDVLELASRRLYQMSRGQFTLRRARGQDDKRKNAGLDLEVEDAYCGTTRATSTLSGGEGFMASLSLALGLADVVQSELGGTRLDAVFVDEGFGTLDPEALDLAMKTLAELQSGGRIVGVISHVPELKDQILRRLFVRKTPEGSRALWENSQI